MKNYGLKLWSWICTMVVSLLGFSACEGDANKEASYEYGTPTADYKYMGTVTDEEGNPIEGINVVFQASGNMLNKEFHRVATDKNGKYETDYIYYILGSSIYQALYTDIDGEENGGHFEDKIVEIHKMDKTKVKDGERWYMGVYDLSAEVKLTKKPAVQEPDNQPEQEPGNESDAGAENKSENEELNE